MNTQKDGILTSEKLILGFRPADLLGIAIMIIPFAISFDEWEMTKRSWIFFTTKETITIAPYAITTLLAVIFYAALIVRFDFFKANNIGQALISSIRAFLDCWVLAALLSFVLPSQTKGGFLELFKDPQIMFLLFAVALTWLGMKTVAGYSWILFILTSWKNATDTNNAMGTTGAVFILTLAISLFLQVKDLTSVKELAQEFKVHTGGVKRSINSAVDDAERRAYVVTDYVRRSVPGMHTAPPAARPIPFERETETRLGENRGVKIDLASLDVNKDGVVDEKDFELLQRRDQSVETE